MKVWSAVVVAKAPRRGAAKTRLIPMVGEGGAAELAEAALHDTIAAARASSARRVVLAIDGPAPAWTPPDVVVLPQRGVGLAERLRHVWADVGGPALQLGMDTPQVTAELLDQSMDVLFAPGVGAVLGLAVDGGWWALGLHGAEPLAFDGVSMSTPTTGRRQLDQLRRCGLHVAALPVLRDVDRPADIAPVAALAPGGRFAAAAARLVDCTDVDARMSS